MTSSAISAQGSSLAIASSTAPAPVNLASITVSTSATATTTLITTSAAHGFVNGTRVTLSGLTGTNAGALNGNTYAISVVSSTTFTIQVNTYGMTITATSATAQGVTYLTIANVKTYNGLDGQASEIDVTNLQSAAKEIRLGLVDFGQIQIELDHNLADPGQAQCLVQYNQGSGLNGLTPFVLNLPNGNTASFTAFVRKFSLQGGVDQVVRRQMDLRISGPVTWC